MHLKNGHYPSFSNGPHYSTFDDAIHKCAPNGVIHWYLPNIIQLSFLRLFYMHHSVGKWLKNPIED